MSSQMFFDDDLIITAPVDSKEFEIVTNIRVKVFVEEQEVSIHEEFDNDESNCLHLLCKPSREDKPVACCRLNPKPPFVKLERVAVLKEFRGQDLGLRISEAAIRIAQYRWPDLLIVSHAQSTVLKFYTKMGFVIVSDEFFDEVNILHHTIMFPTIQSAETWDSSRYIVPKTDEYIPNEYKDPIVVENMKLVLEGVKTLEFIPQSTVMKLIDTKHIGGILTRKFVIYASAVIYGQIKTGPQILAEPSTADEDYLYNFGWEKLNTGHYSQVSEHWRRYYLAVSLCKSIRFFTIGDYEKSINAFDLGLLMASSLLPTEFIISWTNQILKHLPIEDLGEIDIKTVAPPSPLPQSTQLIGIAPMDDIDFMDNYLLNSKPVLIKGAANDWPAIKKWSFSYLNELFGHRLVPVEFGSKYTDADWSQKIMKASEFFKGLIREEQKEAAYLAQHLLLEQIPELKDDISIPQYCLSSGQRPEDVAVNSWVGPSGTVSPLHQDPQDNIFCQVAGTKFVRLISPDDTDKVYAMEDGMLTNTSQVDVENPNLEQFPKFESVKCLDVVVEPGDVLFIPKGFWHHVRSLSPSISLSFWFDRNI